MNVIQHHIIEKVVVDVYTSNEKTGYRIKNNISSFINDDVFPLLEKMMDEYGFEQEILQLKQLSVDASIDDWNNREVLKEKIVLQFKNRIAELLEKQNVGNEKNNIAINDCTTSQYTENSTIQRLNLGEQQQRTFLYFLENGHLPWYGKHDQLRKFIASGNWEMQLVEPRFWENLLRLMAGNPNALLRFIHQFDDSVVVRFLQVAEVVKDDEAFEGFVKELAYADRSELFVFFVKLAIALNDQQSETILSREIQKTFSGDTHFRDNSLGKLLEKSADFLVPKIKKQLHEIRQSSKAEHSEWGEKKLELSEKNTQEEIETKFPHIESIPTYYRGNFQPEGKEKESLFFKAGTKSLLIKNAGMVLFHPFLKPFFERFGWIDNDGKIKIVDQAVAVQALHYCATGKAVFFEDTLVLEKFLCGMASNTVIPVKSLLTDEVKAEAEVLCQSVISNWKALKNTSPDGLRQMFVQRDGKLMQKENNFKLIVERKAQDILLDRLPWNISIVKLPWKDDLLHVEW